MWLLAFFAVSPAHAALPPTTPDWRWSPDDTAGYAGELSRFIGDVDGDWLPDIAVVVAETPYHDRIDLFSGSLPGAEPTASFSSIAGDFTADDLASGDFNGDGFDDLAVMCGYCTSTAQWEGQVFLHLGSTAGLSPTPSWSWATGGRDTGLSAIDNAGDVNGDGIDDLVVGSGLQTEEIFIDSGAVWVFYGSHVGLGSSPDWGIEGPDSDSRLGLNLAGVGDVDGDGFADLMIAENGFSDGETGEGQVGLYRGGADGPEREPFWTFHTDLAGVGYSGFSLSNVGDLDGDGFAELAIGAPGWDAGGLNDVGVVWLFTGAANGPSPMPTTTLTGRVAGAGMGRRVGRSGDLDGDGYEDLVVSANAWSGDHDYQGRVELYLGGPGGIAAAPDWSVEGEQTWELAGSDLSVGDGDGDGVSELLVGAPRFRPSGTYTGEVRLYRSGTPGDTGDTGDTGCPAPESGGCSWSVTASGDDDSGEVAYACSSAPRGRTPPLVLALFAVVVPLLRRRS